MKLTWKVKKGDGYRCESLYCGDIKVATYSKDFCKDSTRQVPFNMNIALPGLKDMASCFKFHDRDTGKAEAEKIVRSWFEFALKD